MTLRFGDRVAKLRRYMPPLPTVDPAVFAELFACLDAENVVFLVRRVQHGAACFSIHHLAYLCGSCLAYSWSSEYWFTRPTMSASRLCARRFKRFYSRFIGNTCAFLASVLLC